MRPCRSTIRALVYQYELARGVEEVLSKVKVEAVYASICRESLRLSLDGRGWFVVMLADGTNMPHKSAGNEGWTPASIAMK